MMDYEISVEDDKREDQLIYRKRKRERKINSVLILKPLKMSYII